MFIYLMTTFLTGITAFITTNIDDIFILLVFFSQVNSSFRRRHIVAGQYLGFAVLLIASLPGLFGGLIIPSNRIGLLGLVPIAIGISGLINQQDEFSSEISVEAEEESLDYLFASFLNSQTYNVAAITIANGSDNISVYVPLFASGNLGSFLIITGIFIVLVAVWCYIAYKFTSQKIITNFLSKYASYIVPFVFIGLGIFIILKSEALSFAKLVASCICLMIIVKDNHSE